VELLERDRERAAISALLGRGGVLLVEGAAGIGKTALLDEACRGARDAGREVVRARGSELERGFAFGVVRQLLERRIAECGAGERAVLLAGAAGAARAVLAPGPGPASAPDGSFAVLHGLSWVALNLAARRPVLVAVDDAHAADRPSLAWLAHLAPRIEGAELVLVLVMRPDPGAEDPHLAAVRGEAAAVVRPQVLSAAAVARVARAAIGDRASDEVCDALAQATGGNPFYVHELLRELGGAAVPAGWPADPARPPGQAEAIVRHVAARIRGLDPNALGVAQAVAVLGDGCELRHAAAVAAVEVGLAGRVASGLVRRDVLADDRPPRFLHPVVREAVEATMGSDRRDEAHRAAARALHLDRAAPGRVAAHLLRARPAGDPWTVDRLREAARVALDGGAPRAAAELLARALAEPPPPAERVPILRESARAEAAAGLAGACARLEEALALTTERRRRAAIAIEIGETYASLFRWVDAVDALERALAELGDAEPALARRLEGELVVAGLHDARRAARVGPVLARLSARRATGAPDEALAVARGMSALLAGRPATDAAAPLEDALARAAPAAENWDTRAALLWSLVTAERFAVVEDALGPMLEEVRRSGSARGLVAAYSTLGLLKLRLGALPEADAASRVALSVLRESDLTPGIAFAATVLADVAVEAGDLDEAEALIALLPQEDWPAGVGTVLIPAARGRLRLAQGREAEALADFQACGAMFAADLWGAEMRDVGYLHARSGAAMALLRLGERAEARALAQAELRDVLAFGGARAMGVALRVAGLAAPGGASLERLARSAAVLRGSPAALERARSLAELGAALRRAGRRAAAREPLGEALDLAARCGARPLAARVREELRAAGARPRRDWRRGVEALTPSELRVARLAAEGQTNRRIAQSLYVSLKTVEGHLARAYAKLGISGRAELAGALGEKTRVPTPSRDAGPTATIGATAPPDRGGRP
jgi:DNA-binding CsgD family transcriptional regulator